MTNEKTPEQEARDLLERLSDCAQYTDPQAMSSGDIVELANLIRDVRRLANKCAALTLVAYGTPENPRDPLASGGTSPCTEPNRTAPESGTGAASQVEPTGESFIEHMVDRFPNLRDVSAEVLDHAAKKLGEPTENPCCDGYWQGPMYFHVDGCQRLKMTLNEPAAAPGTWVDNLGRTHTCDPFDCQTSCSTCEAEPSGWQPIETAPKDGTHIELWVVHSDDWKAEPWRIRDAWWEDGKWVEDSREGGESVGIEAWHRDGHQLHFAKLWLPIAPDPSEAYREAEIEPKAPPCLCQNMRINQPLGIACPNCGRSL